ncbi:MAG: universal stress protein [Thermoplasmatota archaeon]
MYKKVILPTDGSELSMKGVEEGLKAAKIYEIPALAVYVISPGVVSLDQIGHRMEEFGHATYSILRDQMKERGEKILEKIKKKGTKTGVEVKTKLLEGIPYEEISKVAGKDDIIYICSHGRSGFTSLFLGSTTSRVIKHTNATVAVVKAD